MKKQFTLFTVLICITTLGIFGFFPNDDRGRTPRDPNQTFNNPIVVNGPLLDNPLPGLMESFESPTFPPTGWSKVSVDGGTGWERQTVGTTPIPGWNGGEITAPTGGGNAVAFCTYTTGGASSNNQWLISPQISNIQSGAELSFWLRFWPSNIYSDTVSIRISTTGSAVTDFTTHVATITFPRNSPDTNWTEYSYDIGSLVPAGSNIYLAFQERVNNNLNDGASASLDLVEVTKGSGGPMIDPNIVCDYGLIPQYPGVALWGHASEVIGDTLYIVGGSGTGAPSTTVTRYAVNSGNWSAGTPLPTAKSGGDLVSVDGSMYYIGGGNTAITAGDNITYKYTPSTGWSTLANIPTPVTGNTAQVWGDSVIFCIAGGWSTYLTTIQVYRIGSDTWTTSTALPGGAGRRTFASGISGNKIYVAGGYSGAFRKDLRIGTIGSNATTITWTMGTDIPCRGTGLSRNGGLAINDKFYVLGSETSPAPGQQDSIFILDTQTDTWLPQILVGRGPNAASNYWGVMSSSVLSDGTIKIWIPGGSLTGAAVETKLITLTDTAHCTITGITDPLVNTPDKFTLHQNYPNPFNPSTQIRYEIPVSGLVTLKIYDMVGREVATLVNDIKTPGSYIVAFNASAMASGTYFYKIQAGDFVQVKKMVLLK